MSRRRELFVPPIMLDRAANGPLPRQIYGQIAQAIRSRTIHYEARLPSTRVMARLLGVSEIPCWLRMTTWQRTIWFAEKRARACELMELEPISSAGRPGSGCSQEF